MRAHANLINKKGQPVFFHIYLREIYKKKATSQKYSPIRRISTPCVCFHIMRVQRRRHIKDETTENILLDMSFTLIRVTDWNVLLNKLCPDDDDDVCFGFTCLWIKYALYPSTPAKPLCHVNVRGVHQHIQSFDLFCNKVMRARDINS